jgi:hypothetical protein
MKKLAIASLLFLSLFTQVSLAEKRCQLPGNPNLAPEPAVMTLFAGKVTIMYTTRDSEKCMVSESFIKYPSPHKPYARWQHRSNKFICESEQEHCYFLISEGHDCPKFKTIYPTPGENCIDTNIIR